MIGICGQCGNTVETKTTNQCCGGHHWITLKTFKSNKLARVYALEEAKENLNMTREELYLAVMEAQKSS